MSLRILQLVAATAIIGAALTTSRQERSVAAPSSPMSIAASTASAFSDSWGVDTHFNYTNTPYGTAKGAEISALLAFGVHHIRDGTINPSGEYAATLAQLCRAGIHHTTGFNVDVTPAKITQNVDAYGPQCIDEVEPQNEYDSSRASDWPVALEAEQKVLYQTMKGTPRFASVTVLAPALAGLSRYALLPDLDRYSDAQNMHDSPCDGNPGTHFYRSLESRIALLRQSGAEKPIWTTETSYSDATLASGLPQASHCGLPDDVIAKYIPRSQALRFMAGQPRIYWYEFSDQPSDAKFGAEGFVDAQGRPKPQYLAVQSLLSVLADRGTATPEAAPTLHLDGDPNARALLLRRSDGTVMVLAWLELPSWDPVKHLTIANAPQPVRITVDGFRLTGEYQYDSAWKLRYSARAGATVSLSDAISVITFDR